MSIIRLSSIIFLVFSCDFLFSEAEIYYGEYKADGMNLTIEENSILYQSDFRFPNMPSEIFIDNYTWVSENEHLFIIDSEGNRRLLLLQNEEVTLLYAANIKRVLFIGVRSDYYRREPLVSPWDISSSSFLVEGSVEYGPTNVGRKFLNLPWVEGVTGQGEGEFLQFSTGPFASLVLFNGFISFDRTDLFEKNSRVRRLRISSETSDEEMLVELNDTPDPQFIDLSLFVRDSVKVEIVDVYPGSLYQDTCIGGMSLTNILSD